MRPRLSMLIPMGSAMSCSGAQRVSWKPSLTCGLTLARVARARLSANSRRRPTRLRVVVARGCTTGGRAGTSGSGAEAGEQAAASTTQAWSAAAGIRARCMSTFPMKRFDSGPLQPHRVHVERVQRLPGGHEQPVLPISAEAEVGATLGQVDAADEVAVGGVAVHPVVPLASPTRPRPDVPVAVHAQTVAQPGV